MKRRKRPIVRHATLYHSANTTPSPHKQTHLNSTRIRLYINNIPNDDLLLKYSLIDTRIQPQLFSPLDSFKTDDDVRDRLAVPA